MADRQGGPATPLILSLESPPARVLFSFIPSFLSSHCQVPVAVAQNSQAVLQVGPLLPLLHAPEVLGTQQGRLAPCIVLYIVLF